MNKDDAREFHAWLDDIGSSVMYRSDHFRMLKEQFCKSEGDSAAQSDLIDGRYLRLVAPAEVGQGETQFLQVSTSLQVVTSRWPQPYELALRYVGQDWLRISFMLQGRMVFDLGEGQPVWLEGAAAFLGTYPAGHVSTDVFGKGADIHWASILIKREELMQLVGVDLNLLPREMADMLQASQMPVYARQYPLNILCARILSELLHNQMGLLARPIFMQAKALELLAAFFDQLTTEVRAETAVVLTARDRRNLALAREIIEEDMFTTLKLPDIARMVGLNRNKLSLGFHRLYGMTIQNYGYQLKMQAAEDYLRRREGSLEELAVKLGYRHANNLSAAIKKHFGISAKEIRKQ
jgi:AraC-like DNA-binding protein